MGRRPAPRRVTGNRSWGCTRTGRLEGGIGPAEETPIGAAGDPAERELRAKYHDWCSARLAERFLQLSPSEIYELAERAPAAGSGGVAPQLVRDALPDAGNDPFRELIERVTEVLIAEVGLPTFEQWAAAYEASPAEIERDLLGFWRDAT
jgi:hypothetical protein